MSRGLLLLAAAGLVLPFAAASAGGSAPSRGELVELVITLKQPPLAVAALRQRRSMSDGGGHGRLALRAPASVSYLRRLTRDQNALESRIARAAPGAWVRWRYGVVLDGLAVVAPAGAKARIASLPGVAHVYESVRYRSALFRSPAVIGAPQVWGPALATAGDGIKIGILDDGVDQSHPFFSPRGFAMPPGFPKGNPAYTSAKVIVARSFPPPGATWRYAKLPFDPTQSDHATHVAGIAAGDYGTRASRASGPVNVTGVAPHAYIGNYRVLTIPTDSFGLDGNSPEIVAGIEAAVRDGMNVINLSLGEPEITPSRDIVVAAIDAAADAGVVPVISSGNDFDVLGFGTVSSPGSAPKAITVAAATKSGQIAYFSSSGPTPVSLDLKPDVTAPGVNVLSSVPTREGSWESLNGTSMASPHVAGGAALLLQRHPTWTVEQVKSALVLTGNPVAGLARGGKEAPPTREGGGMIWLPRADQPLVFASPTNLSFGLLQRGRARSMRLAVSDAGGGAGAWSVSVNRSAASAGVTLTIPPSVTVPGSLTVRAAVSKRATAGEVNGFVVLTRVGQTRRIPFWLRASAALLAREPSSALRRPGVYRGDTRGKPALVSSYRYPDHPGGLGLTERLLGPEQVFRFVLRRPAANAGAVVLSRAPGTRVSPRLVQAGSEDRLTGYAGLPLRINPYQSNYFGLEPVVGVMRPLPGAYDLVFDTPNRRLAGRFTFRFWVNDTTPPTVRVAPGRTAQGRLLLTVTDRGSGVDPASMLARVDGSVRQILYRPATGRVEIVVGRLARGRHRLEFTVADYQETKNNENSDQTLPNTRRLSTTFFAR